MDTRVAVNIDRVDMKECMFITGGWMYRIMARPNMVGHRVETHLWFASGWLLMSAYTCLL